MWIETSQLKHIVKASVTRRSAYDTGGIPTLDRGSPAATAMRRPMSRKNVAASSPRAPNVSTASGTKQYWSHNAVYFARLRSSASTATVQAAIDARCRWFMAMWSPTPSTCRVTMAPVSSYLDACHHSATDTTAPVWQESPQQRARALWFHWLRCIVNTMFLHNLHRSPVCHTVS